MRKVARWIVYALGALLLLATVFWSISRWRGPTVEQEEALAVLNQKWEPAGRNAYAAIWLLQYDVPESSQAEIVAEDMKRIEAQPYLATKVGEMPKEFPVFESSAKGRFRDLSPTDEDNAMLCKVRGPACLARVRADLKAYTALAARNERLFERVARLSQYDFYKAELPPRMDAPFPSFQLGGVLLTRNAVEFARGNVDAAIDGTCRDLSTWRRLGSNSDLLIGRMIGIAYSTDGGAKLLANMLAEVPRDHDLPDTCVEALRPMRAEELSMCRPMQGEFGFVTGALRSLRRADDPTGSWWGNLLFPVAYDEDMTRAEFATAFAPSCSTAHVERVSADVELSVPPLQVSPYRSECVGNFIGCVLASGSRTAYTAYLARAQDQGARLKLVGTVAWLRGHPEDRRLLTARLASRPARFKSATRDIEISPGGKAIRIRQFERKRNEYWEIPLPPYLWDGVAAD